MKLKHELIKLTSKERLYKLEAPIIALTGGIATGKSTVSNLIKDLPVIDADLNVKKVYQLRESLEFIDKHFPDCVIDREIDFQKLRKEVFQSEENRLLVESYIYSKLPQEFLNTYKDLGKPDFVIYDVPLLFEKSLNILVDVSITVYCPRETQIERLLKRDNIDENLAQQILNSQTDIEFKKEHSDFVIENTGSLAELAKEVEELKKKLFD